MIIPDEIKWIIEKLQKPGYEAYIVGGCVRDFLLGKEPEDWDVTTNAKPKEIKKIFPQSFYENKFLTVTVLTKSKDLRLKQIEITTFRFEAKYSDKRHPDEVKFAKTLKQDLARRDFTINAMAIEIKNSKAEFWQSQTRREMRVKPSANFKIIDHFEGHKDLKNKIIRTVGNPEERFSEDALRMLRAIRFAVVLGFNIEEKTFQAIKKNALWLEAISKERIRDEFIKIIMSPYPSIGIELLRKAGLLKFIMPELEKGKGVSQNKHHIYDCYDHNVRSLDYASKRNFSKHVRLAALLHDIAKPCCKRGQGSDATFYGHEVVGARMAVQILNKLNFSKKDIEKIVKLIRYHLFYYNVDEVGESSIRRLVRQVGLENMEELLQLRMADRIGSGVPKAEPYKLRHLKYLIEKVSKDPISAKMLKINGKDIMDILKIKAGPKVGQILDVLLGYVLLNPEKNKKDFLKKEIKKFEKISDKKLISLAQKAKKEREKIEIKKDEMAKSKYWLT